MHRLALRKKELVREFARHRGTNVRVLEASDGGDDEIAHRLLATPVAVISTTAFRLMRPDSRRRALAESHPL